MVGRTDKIAISISGGQCILITKSQQLTEKLCTVISRKYHTSIDTASLQQSNEIQNIPNAKYFTFIIIYHTAVMQT